MQHQRRIMKKGTHKSQKYWPKRRATRRRRRGRKSAKKSNVLCVSAIGEEYEIKARNADTMDHL
jgi:hypothetical protein